MRKNLFSIILITVFGLLITSGVILAASRHNVTATLGGVAGDYFDLDGTWTVSSLKVGEQGTGGVTFFNGTIVNQTTTSGGADNPVTFGDKVRIDDTIYRGATEGPGDDLPLKLNDDVRIYGDLTVDGNISGQLETTRRVELPLTAFVTDATGIPTPVDATTTPTLTYIPDQGVTLVYEGAEDDTIGISFTVPDDYLGNPKVMAITDVSEGETLFSLQLSLAVADVEGTPDWDGDLHGMDFSRVPFDQGEPSLYEFHIDETTADRISAGDLIYATFMPRDYDEGMADLEIYAVWFEYTASL